MSSGEDTSIQLIASGPLWSAFVHGARPHMEINARPRSSDANAAHLVYLCMTLETTHESRERTRFTDAVLRSAAHDQEEARSRR